MTKKVEIRNRDNADWDVVVKNSYTNEQTVIPPNESYEVDIHSTVVLTITEQPSSYQSRKYGVATTTLSIEDRD